MQRKTIFTALMVAMLVVAMLPVSLAGAQGDNPTPGVLGPYVEPSGPTPGSIAGSTATPDTDTYTPGDTGLEICWNVYNASIDDEWLDLVEITYPPGWMVTAMNDLPGANDSGPHSWAYLGIGTNVATFADASGGFGEQYPDSDHWYCTTLDIPADAASAAFVNVYLSGDDWGSPPHDLSFDFVLGSGLVINPPMQQVDACGVDSYEFQAFPVDLCNFSDEAGDFFVDCASDWFPFSCDPGPFTLDVDECTEVMVEAEPACVEAGSSSTIGIYAYGMGYEAWGMIGINIVESLWQTSVDGQLEAMPTPRLDPAAAAYGDYLIVAGGYDSSDGGCQVTSDWYDAVADTWMMGADQPGAGPCYGGDAAVMGDMFYAAGDGLAGDNALFAYDLNADAWTTSALPAQIGLANEVVAYGDSLYFFVAYDGGYANANQFWRYTPGDGWTQLASVPYAAGHRASWAHGGKIYTAGGYDGSAMLPLTAIYDIAGDEWTVDPGMFAFLPAEGGGAADAYGDGYFIWAGGWDGGFGETTRYWAYSMDDNMWMPMGELPYGTFRFEADWADGSFIGVGGFDPPSSFEGLDWVQRQGDCPACQDTRPDLGDAPDSTNHFGAGMTAYPSGGPLVPGYSIMAHYPTVFDPATAGPGLPSDMANGPLHVMPMAPGDPQAIFLGENVTGEEEADIGFDYDFFNNIDPMADAPNMDGADDTFAFMPDGVNPIGEPEVDDLNHCDLSIINYSLTKPNPGVGGPWYVNIAFDWNRDGDFEDTVSCNSGQGQVAPEWAIQDQIITNLGVGTWTATSPAFNAYYPTYPDVAAIPTTYPVWMRITVTDIPSSDFLDIAPWFGQGPTPGFGDVFDYGETEDYLLTFPAPAFGDSYKTASLDFAADSNLITYDIYVTNSGDAPALDVKVDDPIPMGADCYLPGNDCNAETDSGVVFYDSDMDQMTWLPDQIDPGQTVHMSFVVQVDINEFCGDLMENVGIIAYGPVYDAMGNLVGYVDVNLVNAFTRIYCEEELYDLGDAPDSTNHNGLPMDAYEDVAANFPTVYDPVTIGDTGPRHSFVRFDSWLGPNASVELEADSGFFGNADEDYWDGPMYDLPVDNGCEMEVDMANASPGDAFNLNPEMDDAYPDSARGASNMDCFDEGLMEPVMLAHCETGSVEFNITIIGPQMERWVNIWFDWNRDGDWNDVIDCGSGNQVAPEWAVNNDELNLGAGSYTVNSTALRAAHPQGDPSLPLWARVTLTMQPLSAPLNGGSGPAGGWMYGETEDYYLMHGGGNAYYYTATPTAVEMSGFSASANSAPVVALGWQWAAAASTLALAAAGWATRRRR